MSELATDFQLRLGSFQLSVSEQVGSGEIVALMGPNGSGKSTLLRCVAGLQGVDCGTIRLGSTVWDQPGSPRFVPAEERRVGYVFQDHRLFAHLSVLDNVAFGQRVRGASAATARRDAIEWLERVELASLAARKPSTLSGGQAQRVALARALASQPQVLLLDEPLASMDAASRTWFRATFRPLIADFTGPVLLVSHDPLDALVLADRLLVLEDGRVQQSASPAEASRRPATKWIAHLLGLNLLSGRSCGDGVITLDAGGQLISSDQIPAGQAVMAVLAPSAVALHANHPGVGSPRNVWPATVIGLESLTDRVRISLDAVAPLLVDVTPAAVATMELRPGSQVWVSVKATEVSAWAAPGPRSAQADQDK